MSPNGTARKCKDSTLSKCENATAVDVSHFHFKTA